MSRRTKATLSLDEQVWREFQKLCIDKGIRPSHLVDELMKTELDMEMPPRIKHINIFQNHAVLRDNVLHRTVFVYRRNETLSCDLCESSDCVHVKYTETLPMKP